MGIIFQPENNLNLESGRLCLEFANTAEWHASAQPVEYLNEYGDLIAWAREVGLLTEGEAGHLQQEAARRPEQAATVLEEAIALREALYHVFSSIAHHAQPDPDDLAILNRAVSRLLAQSQLVRTESSFAWDWAGDQEALDRILWPVVRSAADLLTSSELNRVGECADDRGCGWLFLDMSRNRSRQWCDMRGCGNRAKAQRHYEKKRAKN